MNSNNAQNSINVVAQLLSQASNLLLQTQQPTTQSTTTSQPIQQQIPLNSTQDNASDDGDDLPSFLNIRRTQPSTVNEIFNQSSTSFLPISTSATTQSNPPQISLFSRPTPHRETVFSELRQAFSPYNRRRDNIGTPFAGRRRSSTRTSSQPQAPKIWKHKFCLIPYKDFYEVPSTYMKSKWSESGMGTREISFNENFTENNSFQTFSQILFGHFPMLSNGGGYLLYRSAGNGNTSSELLLIPMPKNGYSVNFLRYESELRSAVCYIKPIQRDLLHTPYSSNSVEESEELTIKCVSCQRDFTYDEILIHASSCSENIANTNNHQHHRSPQMHNDMQGSSSASIQGEDFSGSSRRDDNSKDDLENFRKSFKIQNEPVRLEYKRTSILKDVLKDMKNGALSIYKTPEIKFDGEDGVDASGLKKEFFYFLSKRLVDSEEIRLFEGRSGNFVPVHNVANLMSETYYFVGKIITYIVLHSSIGVVGLSSSMIHYLLFNNINENLGIDDIPDYDIQEQVKQLKSASTEESFNALLRDARHQSFFVDAGINQREVNFSNRDFYLNSIIANEAIFKREKEISQLREGMKDSGLLTVLQNNPDCIPKVFPAFLILTSSQLEENVHFNPVQTDEEKLACEFTRQYIANLPGESTDGLVTVAKLVIFCCGEPWFPENGILIKWRHGTLCPDSDTCTNTLFVPTDHEVFESFEETMNGVISCQYAGYGRN